MGIRLTPKEASPAEIKATEEAISMAAENKLKETFENVTVNVTINN